MRLALVFALIMGQKQSKSHKQKEAEKISVFEENAPTCPAMKEEPPDIKSISSTIAEPDAEGKLKQEKGKQKLPGQ